MIVEDVPYLPVGFVAERLIEPLGYKASWQAATRVLDLARHEPEKVQVRISVVNTADRTQTVLTFNRPVEYSAEKRQFEEVQKWQRIDIPEPLQVSLHKPKDCGFTKKNYSQVQPHPRAADPQLIRRSLELVGPLMRFLGEGLMPSGP